MIPATFNIFYQYSNQVKCDGADGKFAKPLNLAANSECLLVTADGRVLARGGGAGSAGVILKNGLKKWQELPEAERKPGAVQIAPPRERPKIAPLPPPPGGLVLAVYTRNLKRDDKGELAHITPEDIKDKTRYPSWDIAYTEPTRDNLWLSEAEWKSLLPAEPRKGDKFPVPAGVRDRIFFYHLWDLTQGGLEHPWERRHLRAGELTLTVEETTPQVRLRLEGSVRFAGGDPKADAKTQRGFEARFHGYLDYDPQKKTIARFSFHALGECWCAGSGDSRFVRPGRAPLTMGFELASGDKPIDRMAPAAFGVSGGVSADYGGRYFAADK